MKPGDERAAWEKAAERFDSAENELRALLEELLREQPNGEEPERE